MLGTRPSRASAEREPDEETADAASGAAITPKQQRFAEEYLLDLDATKAATRAGYSEHTAAQIGYQLLQKPAVKAEIERRQAAISEKTGISQEWVIRRLKDISDRCMQVSPVLDRKGNPVLVENSEGEWVPAFVFDSSGANRATELLGKHLGVFEKDNKQKAGQVFTVVMER